MTTRAGTDDRRRNGGADDSRSRSSNAGSSIRAAPGRGSSRLRLEQRRLGQRGPRGNSGRAGGSDDGPNHDVDDDHGSGSEPGDDSGGHGRGRGRGGDD